MKPRSLLVFILITYAWPCLANSGHTRLFRSASSSLPDQDQKAIYSLMRLTPAKKGGGFVVDGCPPAVFNVEIVDLNKDGTPEVFVSGGNSCTSGVTGNSVWLFTKLTEGRYKMQFGFPAATYKSLPGNSNGYPDIRFGGPGFCEPVWRWNGREYSHFTNVPTASGGCDDR